jgi:phage tail sheath gpL-like
MSLIPILGYPSSWRAPFSAVQVDFGQGPSTAGGAKRRTIYFAPRTSAGAGTSGVAYQITREQDAIDVAGVGSFGHRICRHHLLVDKDADITLVTYAASSGAGVATATGTITVTMSSGSNPTATGTLYFTVCGVELSCGFKTSDTVTTIGDAIAAIINAQQHLPLTAGNSGGVVTLTAKHAGASSGDGTVGVLRFRASVDSGKNVAVATSGAALGLGTGTAGADGATTELTNMSAALANFTSSHYYYMGFTVWASASMSAIRTHVVNKSEPNPGLRCRAFTAWTGNQSSLTTIANTCNFERRHFVWQENSEHDAAELVAQAVAIHRKKESIRRNFVPDNYRGPDWLIKAQYDQADWPTATEINDAVVDGIMPIGSDATGSFLVMSVTSRSKNAAGTIDDFRAAETHRVSFMDYVADKWLARDQSTYSAFRLMDDRYLADGVTLDPNFRAPSDTVTPSLYKSFIAGLIDEDGEEGEALLQNAAAWKESIRCNIDPQNVSRLESGASGRTMDIAHQRSLRLAETTPG